MSYNPGLLFYKHYYKKFRFEILLDADLKEQEEKKWKKTPSVNPFYQVNKNLFDFKLLSSTDAFPALGNCHFKCETTYPGLLIGTGYPHGSGVMGEFKIGFFLDYTTGLPVIPGSSIKGLLRSAFPNNYLKKEKQLKEKAERINQDDKKKKLLEESETWKQFGNQRKLFIEALLKKMQIKMEGDESIKKLEDEIFEGIYGADQKGNSMYFPISQRDIFHDAYIVSSRSGKLFADDYITPHKNTKDDGIPDALKNPTPIQMLKVMPGVTFQFQFDLKKDFLTNNETDSGKMQTRLLSPNERVELFKQIILFLGVGAKTNVGYGHFLDSSSSQNTSGSAGQENYSGASLGGRQRPPHIHIDNISKRNPQLVAGRLEKIEGNTAILTLDIEGFDRLKRTSKPFSITKEMVGRWFEVEVQGKQGRPKKWDFQQIRIINVEPIE